jgi:uncharacterized protein GlcG (DUF336 family)
VGGRRVIWHFSWLWASSVSTASLVPTTCHQCQPLGSFIKTKKELKGLPMTIVKLAQANAIIDAALAEGRKRNFAPLAVAVLDAGGHLIAFQREDGAGFARFDIAYGKAWGALGMGFGTRELLERDPTFITATAAATQGRIIPSPGGVLILDADNEVVGGVGISGDFGDNDEICAIVGIQTAGFAPLTGATKD